MRTSIAESKPAFSPLVVSITIENEQEAKLLSDLINVLGMPQRVRDLFLDYDTDIVAQTSFCDVVFPLSVFKKLNEHRRIHDEILSRF